VVRQRPNSIMPSPGGADAGAYATGVTRNDRLVWVLVNEWLNRRDVGTSPPRLNGHHISELAASWHRLVPVRSVRGNLFFRADGPKLLQAVKYRVHHYPACLTAGDSRDPLGPLSVSNPRARPACGWLTHSGW
jgi:hypothetical protein